MRFQDYVNIDVVAPIGLDDNRFEAIYNLVREGNQVQTFGLRERLRAAKFLAIYEVNGEIVGVASCKVQTSAYWQSTFNSAGMSQAWELFPIEVGYAMTKGTYRGKGINQALVSALLNQKGVNECYATTNNPAMAHILKKAGFYSVGNPFPSKRKGESLLSLYVNASINVNK